MQGKTREEYLKDCNYVLEYIKPLKQQLGESDYFERALRSKEGEVVEGKPATIRTADHPDLVAAYNGLLENGRRKDFYKIEESFSFPCEFDLMAEYVEECKNKLLDDIKRDEQRKLEEESEKIKKAASEEALKAESAINGNVSATSSNAIHKQMTAPKPETEVKPLPKDTKALKIIQEKLIIFLKTLLDPSKKQVFTTFTQSFITAYTFFAGEKCPEYSTLSPAKINEMIAKVARYRFPGDEATSKLEKTRINGSAGMETGTKVPSGVKSSIENSISHRFYRTGKCPSYTPIYFGDLMHTSQYQILDTKAQMLIIDMLDTCNRLYATGRDEAEGFSYTYSQCRLNMSEKWFQRCTKEIVERGWFRAVKQNGRIQYYPSADWQTMPLSETEVQELLQCQDGKSKRVAQKKARQMEYAASR